MNRAPAPEEDRRAAQAAAQQTSPWRFLRRMLNIVVILGSLPGLAWLLATQHDQLARAI